MKNEFQLNFEDHCVITSKTTWSDLIDHGTDIAFDGVVAGIKQVVAQGGHFMIISEDGSILRRIDRTSELNELIMTASQVRKSEQGEEYPDPTDDSDSSLNQRFKAVLSDPRT